MRLEGPSSALSEGCKPRARRRSIAPRGIVTTATHAANAVNGTCRKTARGDTSQPSAAAIAATQRLPARPNAPFRPMRRVNMSRWKRPTVSAAMAGSKMPLTICMAAMAMSTGQKNGARATVVAPNARTANAPSNRPCLRCVLSNSAPIGVCMARPNHPPTEVTRPTVASAQCWSATKKTVTYGPSAPRTSATRKFNASNDGARTRLGTKRSLTARAPDRSFAIRRGAASDIVL